MITIIAHSTPLWGELNNLKGWWVLGSHWEWYDFRIMRETRGGLDVSKPKIPMANNPPVTKLVV